MCTFGDKRKHSKVHGRNKCRKNDRFKKIKIKKEKIKKEEERKKKRENSTELQKANVEAEVYNNNKKM